MAREWLENGPDSVKSAPVNLPLFIIDSASLVDITVLLPYACAASVFGKIVKISCVLPYSGHLIPGPITSAPRPLSHLALSYVALATFPFLTFLFRIRSFPIPNFLFLTFPFRIRSCPIST
jgi:hypothetical protein